MKVFKVYFLALLLIFMVPVLAQDVAEEKGSEEAVSEEAAEGEEAAEEAKEEEAEKKEEVKEVPVEEEKTEAEEEVKAETPKPAEEAPAAQAVVQPAPPQQEETKAEVPVDEPKVTAKVESEGEGEADKKDDKEKSDKKFSVSVTNGFSHGLSKERKRFGYNLNLGASYSFPWKMAFSADVGLNAGYRYDMDKATVTESGDLTTAKVDSGVFDGTPLNLGLSQSFPLFWEIGGNVGISVSLPFTSTEMWEQYNIYTVLTANLGIRRAFKVAKETSLSLGLKFNYSKTFAKEDYAWDDYSNEPLDVINEHVFNLGAGLSLAYKSMTLSVGGGIIIARNYLLNYEEESDFESSIAEQEWTFLFTFGVSAAYNYKDWNFGLGVMTNAPEYSNGNYTGYDTVEGDPSVNNAESNYPFKPIYTVVYANIGYSYSF